MCALNARRVAFVTLGACVRECVRRVVVQPRRPLGLEKAPKNLHRGGRRRVQNRRVERALEGGDADDTSA